MKLECIKSNKRNGNIKNVMGDLNGKIGADNMGYEEFMGKHGFGITNESDL